MIRCGQKLTEALKLEDRPASKKHRHRIHPIWELRSFEGRRRNPGCILESVDEGEVASFIDEGF